MLKSAHYAAINLLFENGHSKREIARLTNHDRETINKVLRTEAPLLVQRRIRKHKLDAFRKPPWGVPCGTSLLTASHHWMLRLMQDSIRTKDLQADVGGTLSIKDSDLIIETMRTGQFGLRKRALS